MLTQVLWRALLATPCIFGVTLVASISPSFAEIDKTPEPDLTLAIEAPPSLESPVVPATAAPEVRSQRNQSELHIGQRDQPLTTQSAEIVPSTPNFSSPIIPSEQQPILTLQTWATDGEPIPLQRSGLQVSQTTSDPAAIPDLNTESPSPSAETPEESPSPSAQETPEESPSPSAQETPEESPKPEELQATESHSNRWHFLFQPYVYIPITIYGDATIQKIRSDNNVSRDIAIDADQISESIKETLNFAFFGDMEAWTPNYHLGLLASVDYVSTSSDDTFTRPVRLPGADSFIPSELDANLDTQVWSIDLAASYRFYDESKVNPEGVSTEFDLGPLMLDVIGGLNISGIDTNLDLKGNLGGEVGFDRSATVVSPLLGARFRVNIAPKFAWVTAGSFSGFGINGLTRWSARSGLDWMFSGNTSVGLGYRFGYLSYDSDGGKDFGLNLSQNGPYLNLSFRF